MMTCIICGSEIERTCDSQEFFFGYACKVCGAKYPIANKEEALLFAMKDAAHNRKKIQGIKAVRLATGCSLRIAKMVYEALVEKEIPF